MNNVKKVQRMLKMNPNTKTEGISSIMEDIKKFPLTGESKDMVYDSFEHVFEEVKENVITVGSILTNAFSSTQEKEKEEKRKPKKVLKFKY